MKKDINENMPTVPMKRIRHLTETLRDVHDDTPISFQLVLTALFPTIWQNIERTMNDKYTEGFLEGLRSK